ncbi:cupin domain-containing protein [Phyllobacterium sp. LjRoot231]|uniref:cupin domain-containing protein n=1 Tax=Phyllobacterium sp. LjRoot231 TaxID=3342289 RepID=UPI003ECD5668
MSTDDPAYLNRGEGRTYQMGRITLSFKASEDAGYSICETVDAPGGTGASLHRHPTYQETHIVMEGEYEFQIGDQIVRLGPGGMAFMPKGVVHGIRKISEGISRQLIISSPAGVFEAFVAEVAAAQVDTGNADRAGSLDFRAICAKHGIEFIAESVRQ